MKIAVIGASGKAGRLILKEAAARGHEVTAIVRTAAKVSEAGATVIEKDIFTLTSADLNAFDAVVNAYAAPHGEEHLHVESGQVLINALKDAPNTRLLVVGGAGSLFVDEAKTVRLVETPEFPDLYKPTALNQGKNLNDLEQSTGVQWTFISPAAFFDAEGKRTGAYQLGADNLIVNAKGDSYVSYADYAIAVVDEIENPKHLNKRFTLVSERQ
ncbi:NAD(P)-dependent oxidoreductase [Paenibacillus harenae]|uniref:NAD(P)-dependent oxidoreductase n=1 Tax=Paenibacillus harenae TaxID=306543 RepID=UPI002792BE77|nr:NAD(P)-dependent oxidoreductase [Paenibacillus harenae]MDQ0058593.1 putative NADH-flavin reductase [Paenibacillus harenae]